MSTKTTFFSRNIEAITTTILSGDTVSETIDFEGARLAAIQMPAALTGTTVSFNVSIDGVRFEPMVDTTGVAVEITFSANQVVPLVNSLFSGIQYLQVVSDGTEGADREFYLKLLSY